MICGRKILIIPLLIAALGGAGACAKRSFTRAPQSVFQPPTKSESRININTASAKELEALPGIGKGLAERIIEHRQKYGPFRRPEHLIMVRGISDTRFRSLRDLITVE